MKTIYVMADSLRRDHAGVYGNPPWGTVRTPNLKAFAETATIFDNAYIGSFPTVPNRRDTHLGHADKGMPFNRWKALDDDEVSFPALLREHGIPSMLITDTQNNVTKGRNIQRDYTGWTLNRGQEGDNCRLDDSVPLEYPVPEHLIRYPAAMWHQVLVNRVHRRFETDWFAPGTYALAMQWLEKNYTRENFFLWIDTFDPHEPWDPPQHYVDMYDPGYSGRIFEAPSYGIRTEMGITDRELQHIRARYAGEVTMVDTWFGRLLETLENLGIADDTAIIFCADHGTCFDGPGDQGFLHKIPHVGADGLTIAAGRKLTQPIRYFPLSMNAARIPLMIRVPGVHDVDHRVGAFVQPWDITATILDLYDIDVPDSVIGKSVLPLIHGQDEWHRGSAVFGNCTGTPDSPGGQIQATDGEWALTLWSGEREPALHNLRTDPERQKNLFSEKSPEGDRLKGEIAEFLKAQGIEGEWLRRYRIR
jgi:arylsulfatase A-like enzyme